MEARALLLTDTYGSLRSMPGVKDALAGLRSNITLAIHSLGVTGDFYNTMIDTYLSFYPDGFSDEKFLNCISKERNQECTRIAVETKMIPSWKDYTTEIDTAIAQDKKSQCKKVPPA